MLVWKFGISCKWPTTTHTPFPQDLKDYMRQAGEVMYTNCQNGEGLVEFGSRGDMEYAMDKLDGSEIGGRRWDIGNITKVFQTHLSFAGSSCTRKARAVVEAVVAGPAPGEHMLDTLVSTFPSDHLDRY